MTDKIVMEDSGEAATYRTDIKGWVSRDGRYFGDGAGAERSARYAGCTHTACRDCGKPTEKCWTKCQGCRDVADEKRFDALPDAEWDGVAMLYSGVRDRYYQDPGEAEDDLDEGQTLADLRLVICKPNYVRPLDGSYCDGDLPEDAEDVPDAVAEAMDAFNEAVHGIVLSWEPGKTRLRLESEGPNEKLNGAEPSGAASV